MRNVISVDVEDYFQVEAFASVIRYDEWDAYEVRVGENVLRILELFARHNVIGTFFVLGWIAERFPRVVREIVAAGHEIGCHGYSHRRVTALTRREFRSDLRRAVATLTQEAQQPIRCYRAPSFSITAVTLWALDVLAEEGFLVDSSVFPVRHDLYGIPTAERFPHWLRTEGGGALFEFPPSTIRLSGANLGVGGGGYLRLIPYRMTISALRHINEAEKQPVMIYFHPWEIDPEQPRIRSSVRSRLRHYTNLRTMQVKLNRLLSDISLTSLMEACRESDIYNGRTENTLESSPSSGADRRRRTQSG